MVFKHEAYWRRISANDRPARLRKPQIPVEAVFKYAMYFETPTCYAKLATHELWIR